MKTPSIKLKYNIDEEVNQFLKFLHHPFFPQHRVMMFKAFPELEMFLKNIDNPKKEKLIIKKFIKNFQKRYNKRIKKIIKQSKKILNEKSKIALIELTKLMDYQWPKGSSDYTAMPTILPFSPFRKKTFYFSILRTLFDKKESDVFFVSTHEISHMVLFEIMEKQYKKPLSQIIEATSLYFLKEILAAAIINQEPLKEMLNLKNYLGNSLLHYLFVRTGAKKQKKQITKFFQQFYETAKYKKQKKFNQILDDVIKIILSIKDELKNKKKIWNKYGKEIVYNPKILKQYSEPIKLKGR